MTQSGKKPTPPTTLHLLCGKIASGKSTLARELAERPRTILISMDDWMSALYPTENQTIEDFARLTARLRDAMGPHVANILRQSTSVVLDFPANTAKWRAWMRSIIDAVEVAHELHVLNVPDDVCKARLHKRNASNQHQYDVDEATFELFTGYFELPADEEGFNVIVHTSGACDPENLES